MCQFVSAIVIKNGDVLMHPLLDSHSDLVRYFRLPDTNQHIRHFAKVELTPNDWTDVSTWQFRLDEDTQPRWWQDIAEQAEATLRARAAKMILEDGEHDLIVDGCWIVAGTATVRDVRAGRIMRVQDSAQIHGVGGSAQIRNVGGSAQIRDVWGSAQIRNVWDSAQIHGVGGSAVLDETAQQHVAKGA